MSRNSRIVGLLALGALGAVGAAAAMRPAVNVLTPLDGDQATADPVGSADTSANDTPPATYTLADLIPAALRPATGYTAPDVEAANIAAFGVAVATAEGTIKGPNQGYDVLFGWPQPGRTFDANSAADHPRLKFPFTDKTGKTDLSSAAGRYQIIAPTYDTMVNRYSLDKGMTPAHQERLLIALLDNAGALDAVKAGRFDQALQLARKTWASLPGAGYNQSERTIDYVKTAYLNAGGAVA